MVCLYPSCTLLEITVDTFLRWQFALPLPPSRFLYRSVIPKYEKEPRGNNDVMQDWIFCSRRVLFASLLLEISCWPWRYRLIHWLRLHLSLKYLVLLALYCNSTKFLFCSLPRWSLSALRFWSFGSILSVESEFWLVWYRQMRQKTIF